MPLPFPGMDPYIEDAEVWSDFHGRLAEEISAELNQVLQPRYVARLTPRVTYEIVEIGELYTVEVRETGSLRLVTAIEFLSPMNKLNKRPGHKAHHDYVRNRDKLLRSDAHVIEIDLLRGASRPPLERRGPDAAYYLTLSRAERRAYVEVWPVQLWQPLPVLPVPLLEGDPDVPLDLGAAVRSVYNRGAYSRLIDYHRPPPPPALSESEARWLEQHLRARGD